MSRRKIDKSSLVNRRRESPHDWARPQVPLPKDRIDQIAAATAVATTDRSKSRWKNKTNEQQGRGSAPEKTFNLDQQSL
jgi:hypothetical protein